MYNYNKQCIISSLHVWIFLIHLKYGIRCSLGNERIVKARDVYRSMIAIKQDTSVILEYIAVEFESNRLPIAYESNANAIKKK